MRRRRQAPTGWRANPTLVGGSDDEAADANRYRQERLPSGGSEMMENSNCQLRLGTSGRRCAVRCVRAGPPHRMAPVQWLHENTGPCHSRHRIGRRRQALVHIEGDGVSLVRWNHDLGLLRSVLEQFDGMAEWKPSWSLLAVPAAVFIGSRRTIFHLAEPKDRSECQAPAPPETRDTKTIWAEQEARNAAIRAMDFSQDHTWLSSVSPNCMLPPPNWGTGRPRRMTSIWTRSGPTAGAGEPTGT